MTESILLWVGSTIMAAGAILCLIGALGLLRLPDVFTRIHAASLIDTLGMILVVVGMIVIEGFTQNTLKLGLIALFILFTAPVATHALAKAAIKDGIDPMLTDSERNQAEKKETSWSRR